MKIKEAISVYNPQDPLENTVQDVCHEHSSVWLPSISVKDIIEGFVGYDGLFEEFLTQPKLILEAALSSVDETPYIHIPCYTIELRQILRKRTIVSAYKIASFGSRFAKRSLGAYPVVLVLDKRRLPNPAVDVGAVSIYGKTLNIAGSIVRILCRERMDSDNARYMENIVREECPEATVHALTELPGLAMPKVAQLHQFKKFLVNIGSLGIENEHVKAHSPEEAVQDALTRKRHEMQVNHLDPKFTVDFWKRTEFWPMIVREAKSIFTLKTAQAGALDIKLTPVEQKVFSFLTSVNQKYKLGLTFRVAGGWVRDKALGKESDDIDIALDKMTGSEFGKFIQKEIGKSGNVIKANPDQSKHLETMTINLFGQDIDFVNLRSETYGNTRIPEMAFGDPETDAARRDLTINSLFYNVNNGQVEDFTGKGLEDLKSMTLRTPLDPVKTFMDDPLRILRMLRFMSRYSGAQVDPAAIEAMKDPSVQAALKEKVSPERVYTEWNKLFAGSQQTHALRVMHDTGLWQTLFADHLKGREQKVDDETAPDKFRMEAPKALHPFTMDQNNPYHVDNVLEHTLKVIEKYDAILRADGAGDDERAKALAAAWLHDLGKLDPTIIGVKEDAEKKLRNTYHGHEDVSALIARSLISALKASNEDVEYIEAIVANHMLPHNDMTDKQIRKLINKLGRDLVKRIVQHAMADADSKPNADLTHYQNLLQRVQTIEPSANMGGGNFKPVLSGQVLMQMFPNLHPKTGFIKEINTRLQDMKDENPAMTDEQAQTAVEGMRADIETKFSQMPVAPKPIKQNLPINATPPPTQASTKETMKKAQTWYEQMRQTGEKASHVEWLCGQVVKGPFGFSGNEAVFIKTNENSYKLKVAGEMIYDDDRLSRLVGKSICAKGLLDGAVFTFSEWKEHKKSDSPNQKYLKREEPKEATDFAVGQKVRHRQRGLSFSQITGEIRRIQGNLMYVKWDGVKDMEVFNLNDTVNLYSNLAKI